MLSPDPVNRFQAGAAFRQVVCPPACCIVCTEIGIPGVRVGVSAGLAVGNAVKRNRAKRLLRAAMSDLIPHTAPGSDLLLIARSPLPAANAFQTRAALTNLLKRAGLLTQTYDV